MFVWVSAQPLHLNNILKTHFNLTNCASFELQCRKCARIYLKHFAKVLIL